MRNKEEIKTRLREELLILDGAMGTELQKRGMPAGVCPEIWALENPGVLQEIHRAYRDAGSKVVYTCTFGANPVKLADYGWTDVEGLNRRLAEAAREVLGDDVLIAGDISSTGRFVEPFGDFPFEEAVDCFKRQVRGLLAGGVDLFVIETQIDIQEARAALLAVKECCDGFTLVTMTFEKDRRTLNGTTPEAALITLQSLGADAVGVNCSTGPAEMLEVIKRMAPLARVPLAAKPNAGMPGIENGKTVFPMGPEEFAAAGPAFWEAGVRFFGGCCGTTPEHIRRASRELEGRGLIRRKPDSQPGPDGGNGAAEPETPGVFALSSAREALISGPGSPLGIIGERINPTGKKALQGELAEGRFGLVSRFAREQRDAGADLLDINAGMPGIDEGETLLGIIRTLAPASNLPLVIDSADPETVEKAVRLYPGRALINSLSGEKEKLEKLLPVAAKYGAAFILLPLTDGELPEDAPRRMEIVEEVFARAAGMGFREEDILVDGLVMTVSSRPDAPAETLKTIALAARRGFGTVLGLSNVSFGLPAREWINGAFLAMAMDRGLRFAIANPGHETLMNIKFAGDLLLGRDFRGGAYIRRFAENTENPEKTGGSGGSGSAGGAGGTGHIDHAGGSRKPPSGDPRFLLGEAVLNGEREAMEENLRACLAAGDAPKTILEEMMIPAILRAGDLYDKKRYFLPQLMGSAEAMQAGFAILEPLLAAAGTEEEKARILIATVEGDIHDIGKNIVVLMLKNYGFRVIDLGKDVSAGRILQAVREHKPDILGLSALMTTTMVRMPEVIRLLREEGITIPVMVGGAVVTPEWAESIGAHYSADGVGAVKKASELA